MIVYTQHHDITMEPHMMDPVCGGANTLKSYYYVQYRGILAIILLAYFPSIANIITAFFMKHMPSICPTRRMRCKYFT